MSRLIADKYKEWAELCELRFQKLKQNEEKLNSFFIELYGISDEISPQVSDAEVTVRKAELERDIKSLISYAVGCIFGRYSLDREGLCYAGGKWDSSAYNTIIPCSDNIMPINDITDGLTKAVTDFIEKVYGSDTLDENLTFIANALGSNDEPHMALHKYLRKGFFADHSKIYKNRPIYWQFTSGKKGAFKAVIYMHRYNGELLERLESEYALPFYNKLLAQLSRLNNEYSEAKGDDKVRIRPDISRVQTHTLEMEGFLHRLHGLAEEHISLDLDDGVKINYSKLSDILE